LTEAAEQGAASGPRTSRWLKIGLIGSVAVNLLVLGAIFGTMYAMRFGPHGRHFFGGRPESFGLWGVSRSMPDERGKAFRKELSADRKQLRPMMDEARDARREAAEKLGAEPFDRAALEAAIAKVGEKERAFRETAVSLLLSRIDELTPDERHALAESWQRKTDFFRRGKRRHDREPEQKDGPDGPPPPPEPPVP